MNISATAAMGYTYTNIKTGVSQKKDVSNENTCEKQTQKEYKNVVKEYKQKHPDSASHVNQQVQAGKNYMKNCGGDEISRSDMTMDEYKAFFKNLMDGISFDSSQANCKEMWSITEDGWEQMKNDPEYEAWVLGYTIENVVFKTASAELCPVGEQQRLPADGIGKSLRLKVGAEGIQQKRRIEICLNTGCGF